VLKYVVYVVTIVTTQEVAELCRLWAWTTDSSSKQNLSNVLPHLTDLWNYYFVLLLWIIQVQVTCMSGMLDTIPC